MSRYQLIEGLGSVKVRGGPKGNRGTEFFNTQSNRWEPLGSSGGGSNMSAPSAPQITSSSSVLDDRQSAEAISLGASALVADSSGGSTGGMSPFEEAYLEFLSDSRKGTEDYYGRLIKAQELTFDAAMASKNLHYKNLSDELRRNYKKSVDVAVSNAQALNPYSQAKGAQTAANFTNLITARYEEQAIKLQRQADVAEQELVAGNYQAYIQISEEMRRDNQQFQQNMFGFMQEQKAQMESSRRFDIQQRDRQLDNYVDALSRLLPTMEEISAMSDEELLGISAVREGIAAGYDLATIRQDLMGASELYQLSLRGAELDIQNTESIIAAREGGGGGGSSSDRFTDTQLNKGALRAGLPLEQFTALDSEVQNFYVSMPEGAWGDMSDVFNQIRSGDLSKQEALALVQASDNAAVVKDHLSNVINSIPTTDGGSDGNFLVDMWDTWTDWLSEAVYQ